MHKHLYAPLILLVVAALACNMPMSSSAPTAAQPSATSLVEASSTPLPPTSTVPAATATQSAQPATKPVSPTPAPPTQAPATTQPPALAAGPVVLSKLNADPAQLSVVDPLTGKIQTTFNAAGLMQNAPAYVAADAVFYLDSSYKLVQRAGFDGSVSQLTFINPSTTDVFKGVILPSPDGKKIVWGLIAGETASSTHDQLIIANTDGSAQQTLVDETANPPASWSPVGWSPDGQWLYFASTPYGIGGYILFNGVTNVRRVPVKGGKVEDVLSTQASMGDVAISPDGSTLAYIQSVASKDGSSETITLELHSVASQKVLRYRLPEGYLQAGAIVWSPDSQSLVLNAAVGDPDHEAFTLLQADASLQTVKTLLLKDTRLLRPVTWPVADVLWLKDSGDLAWRMDLPTGQLTQAGADLTVLSNSWH